MPTSSASKSPRRAAPLLLAAWALLWHVAPARADGLAQRGEPSLRWWPTVHTTLPVGATLARADGTRIAIESHASGVFPNVNVGWEF